MHRIYCNSRRSGPIEQSTVPHLRRLKIRWNNHSYLDEITLSHQVPWDLFDRDVFFHLTHFSLMAAHFESHVVPHLLSMLSGQCSYSLDIRRGESAEPSIGVNVVLHAIQQLKGRQPVQVEFNADSKPVNLHAFTVPSKRRELDLARYLSSRTTLA